MNFLPKILPRTNSQNEYKRSLIRREAQIGGQLFGPVPKGRSRQFFCLDAHTWVWHEEWRDSQGNRRSLTTRYDVRPDGILKIQDGQHYQSLGNSEARNLIQAIRLYCQRIGGEYQRMLQSA